MTDRSSKRRVWPNSSPVRRRSIVHRLGMTLTDQRTCRGTERGRASLVSGEGLRRAGSRARPADYGQGCAPAFAAQARELPVRRGRPPIGSPRHRRRRHRPPRVHERAPRKPQAQGRASTGEGWPMGGCRGSPLRSTRRGRQLWQPGRQLRVRLREPPRPGSAVALFASPRARRPGCPRSPREDGCRREPSPQTAGAPARRNRQPRVREVGGLLRLWSPCPPAHHAGSGAPAPRPLGEQPRVLRQGRIRCVAWPGLP